MVGSPNRKLAIIILNYNSWNDTIPCLELVQKSNYHEYQLIVVDNGSLDDSIKKIETWAEGKSKTTVYEKGIAEQGGIKEVEEELEEYPQDQKLVLIKNDANLGYSAGNNVGIRYAIKKDIEAVLIVNPDVRIEDPGALKKMMEAMFSNDDIYVVGPNIIDVDGNRQSPLREPSFFEECINPFVSGIAKKFGLRNADYLAPIRSSKPFEVEKVAGSCLLIRSSFLKQVGLLDERVFLYCEEPILSARVKIHRGKILFIPHVTVRHLHRKLSKGRFEDFSRSRLYYLAEYRNCNAIQLWAVKLTHLLLLKLTRRQVERTP